MAAHQSLPPACDEAGLILDLIRLDATVQVGTAGHAFVVDDLRFWLVVHLLAKAANTHRQIGIFVIGRSVVARSDEHTSELQSLMRISYAVFCLKKKT